MYKVPTNSLFIGKELVYMPECHSTNSLALDRCQQTPPPSEGTIIITNNQHAGRGQRGSTWITSPGDNLTFSIILKPGFLNITDQFMLNVCSALSVSDFLNEEGCKDVAVKWPNDVYVMGRKICGILVEAQIRGQQLIWTVVGIGLNINQKQFSISTATSLALEVQKDYELDGCLSRLVSFFEARYLKLRQGSKNDLIDEYERRLYWVNERRHFDSPERGQFEGTISGIDSTGRLRISVGGEDATFGHKELRFVK